MSEYQRKLAGVWKRNDCHPVKSLAPILAQAPVFIGFFTSLKSLALAKASCGPCDTPWTRCASAKSVLKHPNFQGRAASQIPMHPAVLLLHGKGAIKAIHDGGFVLCAGQPQ